MEEEKEGFEEIFPSLEGKYVVQKKASPDVELAYDCQIICIKRKDLCECCVDKQHLREAIEKVWGDELSKVNLSLAKKVLFKELGL